MTHLVSYRFKASDVLLGTIVINVHGGDQLAEVSRKLTEGSEENGMKQIL